MTRNISIKTSDEEIESQLDRLNIAVQQLMIGIEVSAQTPRNPSQLSFAHPDWMDEDERSQEIPDHFEKKFEEVLMQLDRCQMQNEDFWTEQSRRQETSGSISEEYVLKLEKENMELRSKSQSTRSDFTLNIRKNPSLENEKKNFEEKLTQLDKLNESYHQKHNQIIKIQESLRVKERWIDKKEKELKAHWQNFEKTKGEWEKNRDRTEGVREVKHNRLVQSYDKSIFEVTPKPEAPPPETPLSRDQAIKALQNELQELEDQLKVTSHRDEAQKLIMKIDGIKNRVATLRGQKALFESNKSSRLISHMMKTMEKEVNYEENKRKQQLERFTNKKNPLRASADLGNLKNLGGLTTISSLTNLITQDESPPKKLETREPVQTTRAGLSRQLDEKQVLDFRKKLLEKREKELNNRELMLQETWNRVPGSKELIEIVNLTLAKLTQQKNELDNEREAFEKEKVEMLRIRDKLKDQMEKINLNC
jgi:hypothetical protein